jgi:hypothetical protein
VEGIVASRSPVSSSHGEAFAETEPRVKRLHEGLTAGEGWLLGPKTRGHLGGYIAAIHVLTAALQ